MSPDLDSLLLPLQKIHVETNKVCPLKCKDYSTNTIAGSSVCRALDKFSECQDNMSGLSTILVIVLGKLQQQKCLDKNNFALEE